MRESENERKKHLFLEETSWILNKNYSDERVLCSTPQSCLANICTTRPEVSKLTPENKRYYSDEWVLCSAPQTCLANCMYKKTELEKDIEYRCKNLSGFKGFTSDYRS